jgi:hypothetical protein
MSDAAQVREIELEIDKAREFVKRGEALERLYANPDFQEIIGKGYFTDEAVRLVHLKGDPNMQSPEMQAGVIKEMDGISSLSGYFRALQYQAQAAREAIQEGQEFLDEARQEVTE